MKKSLSSGWIYVAIGAFITASLGLYNNFPFLYPDSAAYLSSGIDMFAPKDRPVFYGLFLRATHMMDNVYFSMFAQCALLAFVMYLPFRVLRPQNLRGVWYLLILLILTVTTSWSFFACYLLPDVFGIVLFICTWMLLFVPLNKTHTVVSVILLTYSILVHSAHVFLFGGIVLVYVVILLSTKWRPISMVRAIGIVASVFVLTCSTAFIVNRSLGQKELFGQSSHLFFTSRLNETGILYEFLQRKCETGRYPLCAYKDSLTADFIWDANSPMHKIGGWDANKSEYRRMIGDVLSDPHTLKRIIVMSVNSTLMQFFSFEIEPHHPLKLSYIKERFVVHRNDMDISMQNRGNRLDFTGLNTRQWILVLCSFVLMAIFLLKGAGTPHVVRMSIVFLLCFLLLNAWLYGTFSTVLTRYQGRIICLVPFMVLFWWPEIFAVLKRYFTSQEKTS